MLDLNFFGHTVSEKIVALLNPNVCWVRGEKNMTNICTKKGVQRPLHKKSKMKLLFQCKYKYFRSSVDYKNYKLFFYI